MWLAGNCGKYGGEEKWIQDFWRRKVNERDRLEDEQIKSHERFKRTDPSVTKPYSRQRLVLASRCGLSIPRGENLRYRKHNMFLSSITCQGPAEK
jgi:hypothetical protein